MLEINAKEETDKKKMDWTWINNKLWWSREQFGESYSYTEIVENPWELLILNCVRKKWRKCGWSSIDFNVPNCIINSNGLSNAKAYSQSVSGVTLRINGQIILRLNVGTRNIFYLNVILLQTKVNFNTKHKQQIYHFIHGIHSSVSLFQ